MAAMTAMVIAGAGIAMKAAGAYAEYEQTKENAEIVKKEGEIQEAAAIEEAEIMARQQDKIKASSRVAVAKAGGSGQDQPLLLLAEQSNNMQHDRMNTVKAGYAARRKAEHTAQIMKRDAKWSAVAAAGDIAMMGASAGMSYGSTLSRAGTPSPAPGPYTGSLYRSFSIPTANTMRVPFKADTGINQGIYGPIR